MKTTKKTAPRSPRPKTLTLERFANLTLAEQVDVARPVARYLLEQGIDHYASVAEPWTFDLSRMLNDEAIDKIADSEIAIWTTRLEAARAIGIALGLMLRSDAFANGGAR